VVRICPKEKDRKSGGRLCGDAGRAHELPWFCLLSRVTILFATLSHIAAGTITALLDREKVHWLLIVITSYERGLDIGRVS
jgi:hypothetical protein